jgi:hypothetical protein
MTENLAVPEVQQRPDQSSPLAMLDFTCQRSKHVLLRSLSFSGLAVSARDIGAGALFVQLRLGQTLVRP